ncbi:MAG: hypothetical protein JST43_07220 [Bacteroidetes bacterium]|nr:hypothetical protein [Bacteroidota bacterium]MBS1541781.1 hypothetical protein [Bacteroidota bacterium]
MLPTQVTKNTGEKIVYTYDAGGRKLAQQVYSASGALAKTLEYDGDFIYQGDTLQSSLFDMFRRACRTTDKVDFIICV